jgi:hypothetical protein
MDDEIPLKELTTKEIWELLCMKLGWDPHRDISELKYTRRPPGHDSKSGS